MSFDDSWARAQVTGAIISIVAVIVVLCAKACGADFRSADEKACEAKSGIWLLREHKCVPGFAGPTGDKPT